MRFYTGNLTRRKSAPRFFLPFIACPKFTYRVKTGSFLPSAENPEQAFLELVQDSLAESKTAHFSPFFTFFQLRSSCYAPSKTQKLTENQPVFANGRES